MKVLIAGGSGFLGSSISRFLENEGHEVCHLSRKKTITDNLKIFYWNPIENHIDTKAFENQDVIINLAGEGIANRLWTRKRKHTILESRIKSTNLLVKHLKKIQGEKPIKFISASAIGFYGSRPGEILSESASSGSGFMSTVCKEWEKEAIKLNNNGISTSILRIGIVLSGDGGYLKKMKNMLATRLSIIPGSGKQHISWIHIEDLCRIVLFLIQSELSSGIFNCVSPSPITLHDFQMQLFRLTIKNFLNVKIPAKFLKGMLGEFSEIFLSDQWIVPQRLIESGFQFKYKNPEQALRDIFMK